MKLIGLALVAAAVAFSYGYLLMLAAGHGLLTVLLTAAGGAVVGAVLTEAAS